MVCSMRRLKCKVWEKRYDRCFPFKRLELWIQIWGVNEKCKSSGCEGFCGAAGVEESAGSDGFTRESGNAISLEANETNIRRISFMLEAS